MGVQMMKMKIIRIKNGIKNVFQKETKNYQNAKMKPTLDKKMNQYYNY